MKIIPLDQIEERGIYRLRSRNLLVGVFNGKTGFIGIRLKFDDRYLSTEYHWETGAPHGTAKPLEKIGELPEGIPAREILGSRCQDSGRPVSFDRENPRWYYTDTGETMDDGCMPVAISNKELFDYLEPFDKEEEERGAHDSL